MSDNRTNNKTVDNKTNNNKTVDNKTNNKTIDNKTNNKTNNNKIVDNKTVDNKTNNKIVKIKGDLLDAKVDCILHQCNCESLTAKGLAYSIFKKYSYSHVYSKKYIRKPGTCILCKSTNTKHPFVANLFGQFNRGKPSNNSTNNDTYKQRKEWFKESLNDFVLKAKDKNIKTLGFPKGIGCGLAGGNWNDYLEMIQEFSINNPQFKINMYQL